MGWFDVLVIAFSRFGFVSDFEIRISDLDMRLTKPPIITYGSSESQPDNHIPFFVFRFALSE